MQEDLVYGEDIARCASCSLILKVVYNLVRALHVACPDNIVSHPSFLRSHLSLYIMLFSHISQDDFLASLEEEKVVKTRAMEKN